MGRKRQFSDDRVLRQAEELFWARGYAATTYEALERETGVTARSLVNAFGDKDQLFLLCLENYIDRVRRFVDECTPRPGCEAIVRFLHAIAASPPGHMRNQGCMMINIIPALDGLADSARDRVEAFRDLFIGYFERALDADGVPDAPRRARVLVTLLWGMSAEIRRAGDVQVIAPVVTEMESLLRLWQEDAARA